MEQGRLQQLRLQLLPAFLEKANIDRMVDIDFHSAQLEGFFDTQTIVDHLRTLPLIATHLKS
jgi:phosphoribosylpyrophosphate synthetase